MVPKNTIPRGLGYVSIIILLFVYLGIATFSTFDFSGKDLGDGESTGLVFGTGVYYVIALSMQFVFLTMLAIAGHFDAKYSKGDEKGMFTYPRYIWVMAGFFIAGYLFLLLQTVLLTIYMATWGFGTDLHITNETYQSKQVIMFRSNTIMMITQSMIMVFLTVDAIFVYVVGAHYVRPRKEIEEIMDRIEQAGITSTAKPEQE